ncbi:hypothetical protein C2845_PM18G10030 [Panicum miliaceum]|uniref:Uncharacterized protein n=1 Tax=Panicum miliaceum TaxID=4540 RepID=A0A3L6PJT6_PANMI|nr:hypothetical protein C2845_PM18G10030 [Panicum miliaceum]
MHVPATGLGAADDATPATVRGGAGIVNTSPSSEPRLGRCCCSQPCCRKSTSSPTRCSWHCSPSSATSHPRAENDTVAAGAQKRQRDCRRGAATSSGAPRHAIHAGEAARQEDDQIKVQSFKIWIVRARSDGCQEPVNEIPSTPDACAPPLLLPGPAGPLAHPPPASTSYDVNVVKGTPAVEHRPR